MFFASDSSGKKTHIDSSEKDGAYFCPYCNAPMILKKGDIRTHHFAHKSGCICTDTWDSAKLYDTSAFHDSWQNLFPADNQEIKIKGEDGTHRADVMIGRSVYIFRRCFPSRKDIDEVNGFYLGEGMTPVWIIDASETADKGELSIREVKNDSMDLMIGGNSPLLECGMLSEGTVEVFLELDPQTDGTLIRIRAPKTKGKTVLTNQYEASPFMTRKEYIDSLRDESGNIPLPQMNSEEDPALSAFLRKYDIKLNRQQAEALRAVNGANLVLAVPGSGKTTVLVARLGYMVKVLGIDPRSILAITYNKSAALEMQDRFARRFGKEDAEAISFRTINALSLYIYTSFCRKCGRPMRTLIREGQQSRLIMDIIRKTDENTVFVSNSDIEQMKTAFSYIKNMMTPHDEIKDLYEDIRNLTEKYDLYQQYLHENMLMDFDDQMVFALWTLENRPEELDKLRRRFRYISVDEAQDTSKIQHRIIELLSKGGNLFMVGDEDQSIYGFRAAWPEALLRFSLTYPGADILRMEKNYRSTPEIVKCARKFIERNTGRIRKDMKAFRKEGSAVKILPMATRGIQYRTIAEKMMKRTDETAILYRENESAVVLVDLFLRKNVPFCLRKPEMNFFDSQIVRDITSFLKFTQDPTDTESFRQICHRGVIYINAWQRDHVIEASERNGQSVLKSLLQLTKKMSVREKAGIEKFVSLVERAKGMKTITSICEFGDAGYDGYIEKNGLSENRLETLRILAAQEPEISKYLDRIDELSEIFGKGHKTKEQNPVVLSTIHSAKGQEWQDVYIIDAFEGIFPSKPEYEFDNKDEYLEERRLFYVGMTRAKDHLTLIKIKGRETPFIDEISPLAKTMK